MIKITKEQIGKIIREAIAADEGSAYGNKMSQTTYGDKLKEISSEDIGAATSEMNKMSPEHLKLGLETFANNHPKLQEGPARDLFLSFADNPDSMSDAYNYAMADTGGGTKIS
tara:strand:+ start:3276 stop:3614 length:339 start_codon:yes stop_codon:yes gene_type:complete